MLKSLNCPLPSPFSYKNDFHRLPVVLGSFSAPRACVQQLILAQKAFPHLYGSHSIRLSLSSLWEKDMESSGLQVNCCDIKIFVFCYKNWSFYILMFKASEELKVQALTELSVNVIIDIRMAASVLL